MRTFVELVERYVDPELCPYPEYKGKLYYSIKYIENGEEHVGYSSYSLQVISEFLKKYFISPALEKQEQDRWIPATERLPEDYSDVLVWFEYFRYGSYNRLYQTYGIGNYSAEYDAWTVNHESGWNKLRVIAWRPLPEPYTEEEA